MIKKNKIKSKRKVLQLSATFFMATLIFVSCKKEITNIGDGLEEGSLDLQMTDTFTLETYSEQVNNLETDETAVGLLGSYIDPVFGKVDCGLVTQIRLSSITPNFGTTANLVIDSVVLSLAYTSIKFYSYLDDITVEVYEITEDLNREDSNYYASKIIGTTGINLVESGFENSGYYKPEVIGQQYLADDTLGAHLRVRLDPAFGMDMVNASIAGNMATDGAFVNFFKGLYIKVNGTSLSSGQGTILYLVMESALSNITMYFHDNVSLVANRFVFNINSSCARYNDIKYDRTGTSVESALQNPTLASEAFYLQGSLIRAAVKIPHLMDFNYDSLGNWDPKIINKAELILPIQDFTIDGFDPSTSLFIAKMAEGDLSSFTLDYGVSSSGSLSTVSYSQANKEFRFLITREINGMLSGQTAFNGLRLYSPSFFGSTIERIVFNGANTSFKEKPRLEITYTNY